MDAELGISERKLIEALEEARLRDRDDERPQGALTTAELGAILGMSDKTTRKYLGALKAMGRIEKTEVWGEDLAERNIPFPAYRLVEGETEKDEQR